MSHGNKLAVGLIAVIQLLCSLVFLGALCLGDTTYGDLLVQWLSSLPGWWFSVVAVGYFAIIALFTWIFILFVPTTTKALTLAREHSFTLTASKKGIEHSLIGMLAAEYPQLANATVKVKLNRRTQMAKVWLKATATNPEHLDELEPCIKDSVVHNLQEVLGAGVKHVHLRLTPYRPGEKIAVI